MIWGDMPLAYPDIFDRIPRESTILTWDYSPHESFADWIDPIVAKGFDYWVCPGVLNSYSLMPDWEVSFTNLENFIGEARSKGASGVMTTVWDDGGHHFFGKDWYGIAYAAEQSWRPQKNTRLDFDRRFSEAFYADKQGLLPRTLWQLDSLKQLNATQRLTHTFLEKKILSPVGQIHRIDTSEFSAIEALLAPAEKWLSELEGLPASTTDYSWRGDLKYWRFLIEHLQAVVHTHRQLFAIALEFRHARSLKSNQDPEYQRSLALCSTKTGHLIQQWKGLKSDYIKLWLKENRPYWMEEATSVFAEKITDLTGLLDLLAYAQNLPMETPLPPPALVRLDIRPTTNAYFTFWLVAPPCAMTDEKGFRHDFLQDLGGETAARPTPYDWQKYQSPYADRIDLERVFPIDQPSVQYLYCRITSPTSRRVIAHVETVHPFSFILNGDKREENHQRISLDLKEGKNHLILKLRDAKRLSFYLPGQEVRNRKQKYTLLK